MFCMLIRGGGPDGMWREVGGGGWAALRPLTPPPMPPAPILRRPQRTATSRRNKRRKRTNQCCSERATNNSIGGTHEISSNAPDRLCCPRWNRCDDRECAEFTCKVRHA